MNRIVRTQIRGYAMRPGPKPPPGTAHRPPARFPDPLLTDRTAEVAVFEGEGEEGVKFYRRTPPTVPTPFSTTLDPASPLLRPTNVAAALSIPQNDTETQIQKLPPLLRPSAYRAEPERMSDEKIAEMRALRLSDPKTYSRSKLARMFGCTVHFVSQIAALPRTQRKEFRRVQEEKHSGQRETWGERRALAAAVRVKRREYW